MALGSSMTLSNLSSQCITELFPNKKFINLGCIGLLIKEDLSLLKAILSAYHPEKIIMCGYPIDFRMHSNQELINTREGIKYLECKSIFWPYIQHRQLKFYLWKTISNRLLTPRAPEYVSLKYDECGGIPLIDGGGEANLGRFSKNPFFEIDTTAYAYLDEICKSLADEDIAFTYIHTPVRKGLMTDSLKQYLKGHSQKTEAIMSRYNMQYINTNDTLWDDSLFIDYIHLNQQGAKLVSEYAFGSIFNS
ncbi:hypothetical protein [Saccharicrinis sp. GN24d3]|uniref:hypothetical protein n=1 Tax=Saccharicrinis sp. GN24d3 TaxID=3458416 RepID=UPI0040356921